MHIDLIQTLNHKIKRLTKKARFYGYKNRLESMKKSSIYNKIT
jgi:hypothetical protein